MLERGPGSLQAQAEARLGVALARAMQGRFDEARRLAADADAVLSELGMVPQVGSNLFMYRAPIERLAGDSPAAERHLRRALQLLEPAGYVGVLSSAAGSLAQLLSLQWRGHVHARGV